MPTPDTTRRLPRRTILGDIEALFGISLLKGYKPSRPEATAETLRLTYDKMLQLQEQLLEYRRQYQLMVDATRQMEWDFHNGILALRESVRAQFGPDSDEAKAIGLKKKSERKRPTRQPESPVVE
jgi:hypothetical protein